MAEQRIVLEDDAHLAGASGFPWPGDAAPVGRIEAGDDAEQARLADARGAEQRHHLAGDVPGRTRSLHLEGHALEDLSSSPSSRRDVLDVAGARLAAGAVVIVATRSNVA